MHGHHAVPSGDTWGGDWPGLPLSNSKVLRYAKPSAPSPEMGFPKRGTYDSMGVTGQVPLGLRSNARRGVLSP